MIPRYTLPEMGALWTDQARFERMLEVELAVARVQARQGRIPAAALADIAARARVDVARIAEIERSTDHDVIAFVSQVAEVVGPAGRYLHLGLTSSDVVDTALALQCRAAAERLDGDLAAAIAAVVARAREHAATPMMGRTHSVHAEPMTLGVKLAGWAFELDRARTRLGAAAAELATGKLSGPVGTYSHLDPELEAEVLGELGLRVDPASSQIVARDRHAAFVAALAVAGGSIERFATEIRNLQHTEIGELAEPFRPGQKGSSAMPHKRNPILSERLAGLARLLRGYAAACLEDQALWHERDISHSSVERVVLPDATILLDYMLVRFTDLVRDLVVRPDRMAENLAAGLGLQASGRVLLALVDPGGLSREEAYAVVQRAALRAVDERRPFAPLITADPQARAALAPAVLAAALDDGTALRHAPAIVARLDALVGPARPSAGAPADPVRRRGSEAAHAGR
ncbi:MAG: adenylosuccinate lyase [Chloroflexota bacterium]|nr:MAG: adenylosuccinate lyase [Chloroflexota bacterium]